MSISALVDDTTFKYFSVIERGTPALKPLRQPLNAEIVRF